MTDLRGQPSFRGAARGLMIAALLIPATMLFGSEVVRARGEGLVDITWANQLAPIRAGYNRDEASAVQVAFRADGAVSPVAVNWTLQQGPNTVTTQDTVLSPAPRGLERPFNLTLPPLPPGVYTLVLTADPANTIDEKNETNNRAAFNIRIPNGRSVRFRCDGPEGVSWDIRRIELNRGGRPYPDSKGTVADTTGSTEKEIVINGVEPGSYSGIYLGIPVNRMQILVSNGTFEMPDPPKELTVSWPRTTPYLVGRPKITGESTGGTLGGDVAAPQWEADKRVMLDGMIRNPTIQSADVMWTLRMTDQSGGRAMTCDTLLTLGALATEKVYVHGRIPRTPGMFLFQAEVRVPWPSGFEDLGDEDRVNSHVLPLGWIEILP